MLGIGFFKGQPTEYVIKHVGGRIVREGPGLAFYFLHYNTTIAAIPTNSTDSDFIFNEVSNDFQSVTIQGQFTYRICNPRLAGELLNFSVSPRSHRYISDEPERLPQRISNVIRMGTRDEVQKLPLEDSLRGSQAMAATVFARVREQELLAPMGVELLNLYFLSISPTPEVANALEAEHRESLMRTADEAIYARRAAAVEKERAIKQNELNTDITLEQQREQLITLEGSNLQRQAEFRGKALAMEAEFRAQAMQLEAAAYSGVDSMKVAALALRELSTHADSLVGLLRRE